MAARKKGPRPKWDFMGEREIQLMERMNEHELNEHFKSFTKEEMQSTVIQLMSSFRLAARVANAIWGLKMGPHDESQRKHLEEQLVRSLHDYAPIYIKPHAGDAELTLEHLIDIYDSASHCTSANEVLEVVYGHIDRLISRVHGDEPPPRQPVPEE